MFDKLKIDRTCGKPVSLQIAEYLKAKITDGRLSPGQRFPTTLELSKQLGAGPHTIRQAMKHLENLGLVTCTPKLGTVVREDAAAAVAEPNEQTQQPAIKKLRRIGVVGLVQNANPKIRYCVETAEGITQECDRLGIVVVVLPNSLVNMTAEQMYKQLKDVECEGIIWAHNSMPEDPQAINYITKQGIKVIFRRRSQGNDGRSCIDADYETAGYKTGKYFYENKIRKLLIFSHFDFNTAYMEPSFYGYPTTIKSGIIRAYEHENLRPDIDVQVNKTEHEQVSERIYAKLCAVDADTGIIFTNGYQMLNYLMHNGDKGKELLSRFKTVAISNLTINYKLRPHVAGLDLMVLVDRFIEAGKLLVGNLMGMLDGYFDSATTTLVNVDFVKFDDSFKNTQ